MLRLVPGGVVFRVRVLRSTADYLFVVPRVVVGYGDGPLAQGGQREFLLTTILRCTWVGSILAVSITQLQVLLVQPARSV